MYGLTDSSSLLSLVSPPPASSCDQGDVDPTGVLRHVRGLLTAGEQAGVAPTVLLLSVLARRDRALAARARRTAEWARLLAESLGRDDIARDAHDVALLADIGHLALVETRDNPWLEWQRRRASHDLLRAIPALAHLAPATLSVSERFDGDGLPFGRKGDEIPLEARIARLVRDFDLASKGWWPGQPAVISARACFELVSVAGQTVDPALVHTWLRVLDREVAADVA
ncbi:Response regulator containing a CheY-like receiver domain and an HD-GYP domain protein [Luteitalea pratensis]|uniref:Response regulator containing a CheY-like receiver domain and an HD-GYP domain protein n=1 Tax=Luteitalea pratensis TaxID=1855912 RepID=A0A143PP49_LUTPR|nr:HD domain-containing phosphohydrolase [Luteitalea pratensis]AMY10382.1 Response regulator containing a CheY-like receiver domain and an HD-GYP domain protein [Luteitalea pratensis]